MNGLPIRLLALEPHANGLAFAAFTEDGDLVDWGNFEARARGRAVMRQRSREMIHKLAPAVVGVEDIDQLDCRRSHRVRDIVRTLCQDALDCGLAVARVPRSLIHSDLLQTSVLPKKSSLEPHGSPAVQIGIIYQRTPAISIRKAIRIGFAVISSSRENSDARDVQKSI